ncbi:Uncharacterized protein HZ326_5994 [Fusarium oxysporum f. sp. albedinis]|nr:Uncharacterized protein HZ326_5994 [Fusarium oxysporum f. sp. albedinis]
MLPSSPKIRCRTSPWNDDAPSWLRYWPSLKPTLPTLQSLTQPAPPSTLSEVLYVPYTSGLASPPSQCSSCVRNKSSKTIRSCLFQHS